MRLPLFVLLAAWALVGLPIASLAQSEATGDALLIPSEEVPSLKEKPTTEAPDEPPSDAPTEATPSEAEAAEDDAPPKVLRDPRLLPAPTRRMRELILKAARTGDIERLRPLLGMGDAQTQLAFDTLGTDPISFLKSASGDAEGIEVLGILVEVLEAGFVKVAEPDGDLYVWPYFYAYPIKALTKPQKVELFRILTGGDWQDMQDFGAYLFYRVGITPDGEWKFFLSGDA